MAHQDTLGVSGKGKSWVVGSLRASSAEGRAAVSLVGTRGVTCRPWEEVVQAPPGASLTVGPMGEAHQAL